MKKFPRKVRYPKQVMRCTIYGGVTGIIVGAVGALFQICIHWLINGRKSFFSELSDNIILQCLFGIIFSTVLLVLSLLIVRRLVPEASGSGIQEIEGVLEGKREMCWWRVLPAKFVGGVMSLSSGLVLGREGPTVQMGGAVGQFVRKLFNLNKEYAHILIAAGAGAGLATAFNAPLAGILFVLEEMRHQFKFSFKSFQTVLIACVVADITLQVVLQNSGFNIRQMMDIDMTTYKALPLSSLWLFIIFGAIFGALGVLFNKFLIKSLNFFARRSGFNFWKWILLIGAATGILMAVFPHVVGGGYDVMPKALHGDLGLSMLIILFVLRFFTTLVSYGTGVPGGIFTPMLALGTIFGMFFGMLANYLFPELIPNPQVFAVAGMSALFTATVSAPLTGIVLVVEMTMNYALILPLILTCFSAAIAAIFMNAQPIYSTLLSRTLIMQKRKALYLHLKKVKSKKIRNTVK
ncbi:H(+)/Cl(-) exchange transporter ClcA [Fangia hongkongensis]|uniref:H(+)/Cl(-) exchange transporter ClcA n=1 Tax=Fangia hongkongensis TaxID=270495 RepID=UPI00037CCC5C|nr:H(+)/Cl(-) exchange transporter ClcA [Fangia hongkongensis]MBK2125234.1 H(+)/Cl(-) exchange transporter ClcA [Fangia hongkongensis]